MPRFSPAAAAVGSKTNLSISENMRKPDEMEPSQIKQQIADLTERANALRGYL
jgi:hypothetical protein